MNEEMSLDKIKEISGKEKTVTHFKKMIMNNKMYAIKSINNEDISFSTFFILIPIIKQNNLSQHLKSKYKVSYNMCNKILKEKKSNLNVNNKDEFINILEWMVKSAEDDDGIDDDFDKVIDVCIAKLLNEYKDEKVVKPAVDLAFKRNKKKEYNHDLIWGLFKTNNINVLENIAGYLKSNDKNDNEFSAELLNNAMGSEHTNDNNMYGKYRKWASENNSNVEFTDEGYNFSSKPQFIKANIKAKKEKTSKEQKPEAINPYKDIKSYGVKQVYATSKNSKKHKNNINEWGKWISPKHKKHLSDIMKGSEVHYD